MKPVQDVTPKPPSYPADLETSLILPKQRASTGDSLASLPYRASNPSLHKLFESTASISTSRPSSGSATPTASVIPGSVFSPGSRQNGTGTPGALPTGMSDEHRTLIQQAFAPQVLLVADEGTEELIRGKGLEGGLLQLLRPFGECVPGKVTVRDSVGASKSYEDFGVRFVSMKEALKAQLPSNPPSGPGDGAGLPSNARARHVGGDVAQIEELVDRHLQYSEFNTQGMVPDYLNQGGPAPQENGASPFYTLYMRRLLSGQPMVPHETFSHPVVGVIVTSSRSADPVEQLRDLYNRQHQGDLRFPEWVEGGFLRYYVFIHEEETGDIARSTTTFDSMKRHFGLNCHLLRLKGEQCISSDDDAVRLPTSEWMSASEELAEIQKRETAGDITDPTPYIPESDVTAIKTFVRELVAQSMVPHMERNIHTWNEQVLARRRGLSGRFMSLSKRWTTFGSSRTSSTSAISSSNSNYDTRGFYRPDAPEALMRRLADYCFMLRDTKLALSTYEVLLTDFNNDKAWQHYAGAASMAAFSALLSPAALTTKIRTEKIDEWIKAATYSYTDRQRSATPFYALRTLVLALELLRLRGASATDDAARWAARILELQLVGPVGAALVTERISACFATRRAGVGALRLGSRSRKAAFWAVLAAQTWAAQDKALQAEKCLDSALALYGAHAEDAQGVPTKLPFEEMQRFVEELRRRVVALRLANRGLKDEDEDAAESGDDADEGTQAEEDDADVEEATETLDENPRAAHRKSLIGAVAPNIDTGPLSPALERNPEKDDLFEGAV